MRYIIPIYKPLGMTPFEVINIFKDRRPIYKNETISYAGRLDPMAEGLLLLLVGDENKKRKNYEDLQKTYEFRVLLGIETDTYDILGKIVHVPSSIFHLDQAFKENQVFMSLENGKLQMENLLHSFTGKKMQAYPPYSSKTVSGKPLYWWARQNRLDEIETPRKEIEIYSLELLAKEKIMIQELRFLIQERISKVNGDFRQKEILREWNKFFNDITLKQYNNFPVMHCRVTCSSGTYVRSLSHEIGKQLGASGIALQIIRTKVGEYTIEEAFRL